MSAPGAAVPTRAAGIAAQLPPFPAAELKVPTAVLVALAIAEYVTAAYDPRIGLPAHMLILAALILMGAASSDASRRELFWSLTLAPVIRIGSLSLPLGRLPLMTWYPIIGLPIFAAAFVTARKLGYGRRQLGISLPVEQLPIQLTLVPLGLFLGLGEYLIFRPAPLAPRLTLGDLWLPSLILLVFTGFQEEYIFRGIMQRAALRNLGRWGLVYINLVFAVLHIGYLSVLDLVFVFLVGLMFSLFALRTKTIFGVTLAHGAINTGLFLIYPFLAPVVLGTGPADLLPLPLPAATPTVSPPG